MNLLKLVAKIILDGSGFKAGMKEVQKITKDTSNDLNQTFKNTLAGYFGYQAIKAAVNQTIEQTVRLKHLSEQYGITTDELQRYGKAAREVGMDDEAVGQMTLRMGAKRREAAESNEELRKTFERVGVSLEDLQNPELSNIDLITKIGKALRGVKLTDSQMEDFRELAGRSAPRLLEAIVKAQEQGPIEIISQETIDRIDEAHIRITELMREIKVKGAGIMGWLLEKADEVAEVFYPTPEDVGGAPTKAEEENARKERDERKRAKDKGLDKVAIGHKNAADKAELDLTRTVLETEVKRKGVVEQIRQLKKEVADAEGDAATYAESAKKNDIDREFVAERMADAEKARQQLLDIQGRGVRGASADSETERGNVIGSLARLRYFETLGAAGGAGGDPIPKQQLSVAVQQRALLQRIAEARVASAVFSQ